MFCLLGLGYFWPHFSNKVSPKQTCLTLFFHIMEFLINGFAIILEDSASLICSDDQKTKGQLRISLIQCSTNPQIQRICFLFGCEHFTNYLTTALKSVVWCLENDELPSTMSSLMLLMLPLQVACAKSLSVQQAARCQVGAQKPGQARIKRECFQFPHPNSTLLSFPTSPPKTRFAFLALGILTFL